MSKQYICPDCGEVVLTLERELTDIEIVAATFRHVLFYHWHEDTTPPMRWLGKPELNHDDD